MTDHPAGTTIVDVFWRNAARYGPRPALRTRTSEGWEALTWESYATSVRELAAGLVGLGLRPGDRVGLLSGNRREWHLSDMAVLSAGGVTVPVYPTNSSSQVAYVLSHSGCRFVVVEGIDQLAKVLLRRDELPDLERIFVLDRTPGLDHDVVGDLEELAERGRDELAAHPSVVDERSAALTPRRPGHLRLHVRDHRPAEGSDAHPRQRDRQHRARHRGRADRTRRPVPVLPPAVAHRRADGEPLRAGALRRRDLVRPEPRLVPGDLLDTRPTIFFAVPRVWEKFREGIREKVERSSAPQRALAETYLDLAARRGGVTGAGEPLDTWGTVRFAALDRVVGRSVRAGLGLDRARFLVSGAAPVHPDLLRWFDGIGLPIAEVYGQTEDCGVTTLNPPGAIRIGTVGPAVPGVEVRIADDGEILVRGANVSPGYHAERAATEELLDDDGWMHTGDLGSLDADGYLTITGRKKDLIINSSGKNISPQEIETRLRFEPLISQAVVVGDGRPYLTALLTLDPEMVREWATHHGRTTFDLDLDVEAMASDPDVLAEVADSVERVNAEHARVEGIKRWHVLPRDLTINSGELTPTLKVKRQVVADRWADEIEAMYAG